MTRNQSRTTTPVQRGPGSAGEKGVLCILQSSSIIWASLSDFLVSHSLGNSYLSVEMQSVYSVYSSRLDHFYVPDSGIKLKFWKKR